MESLNEVIKRLQAIIDTAVDGIVTINERGIIETVNPAVSKIFGYEPSEMLGKNIGMLMPASWAERHDSFVSNYLRTGEKKIIGIGREVTGQRKDGFQFPFWLSVSEVVLGDKHTFTGIVHDITEQKKAEAEIRRLNQELEDKIAERTENLAEVVNRLLATNSQLQHEVQERKAIEEALRINQEELKRALEKEKQLGELKSRFVSMASHEFRTPLSTILSSASLMIEYTQTEQQPQREKHYQKIRSAVNTLTGILNDFLSLSKLEEGKVDHQPEPLMLVDFCKEMIEEMKILLKKGQVVVHETIGEERVINLDKRMLKNVMINLFSNAIKYSAEGKTITCQVVYDANEVTLKIIDQGIGIPEEEHVHLFDRFFRAANAVNIPGTGLGLNIVKRYVEMMHGAIAFESNQDKGTTFKITFKG